MPPCLAAPSSPARIERRPARDRPGSRPATPQGSRRHARGRRRADETRRPTIDGACVIFAPGRGQVGRELGQARRSRRRPASRRVLGRRLQLRGHERVGPARGQCQMTRPFLPISNHLRERTVHSLAAPDRRLLVANRGEQRMTETDTRALKRDHSLSRRELQRRQRLVAIAMRVRHQLRGRAACQRTTSNTSRTCPGNRSNRAPSKVLTLAGTGTGSCDSSSTPVWPTARPSSSAKNGFPPLASAIRPIAGLDSASPSRPRIRR